jgi:glycosyltransferase involved in cell wall biosynthesis
MEAQAQGLACVATDVSAIHELIVPDVTGVLVPPENSQALARALESMILDPMKRGALGEAARRRVSSEFGMEGNIDRLAEKFGLSPLDAGKARTQAAACA